MRDSYYFPHDTTATDDPKIMLMIAELGLEAYGIYWTLIEHLRNQPDFKSNLSVLKALGIRFNSSEEKYKTVVKRYELFKIIDEEIFFSQSLVDRMKPLLLKRKKLSIAGRKGNVVRWRSGGDRVAIASKGEESKEEKSKVKEIKEKKSIEVRQREFYNSLTLHIDVFNKSMIEAFYTYWSEPNKSNTKMRCELEKTWSLTGRLATWEKRDEQFNPKSKSVWDKLQ